MTAGADCRPMGRAEIEQGNSESATELITQAIATKRTAWRRP